MANSTGANLIIAVKAEAARANDSTLITSVFTLAQLNEAQSAILRKCPRLIGFDLTDKTTYRVDRWSTDAVTIVSATRASTGIVTVSATAHGLEVSDMATVAGTSGAATSFNGLFEVLTVADANTFTYFSNLADEAATTVGTVTKTAAKPTLDISTLNPAHLGGIWLLNGGATRQDGIQYVPLPKFRERYIPVSNEGATEPEYFTRQGNTLTFNCPISGDFMGLQFHIDYTAWATALADGTTASEIPDSDDGLKLFALAKCFDTMALSMPRFESKALKTRVLFNNWLDDYKSYYDSVLEELYDDGDPTHTDYGYI